MKLRIVLFALVLAACKSKSTPTTAAAPPPTPCRNMATHVTEVVRQDMGEMLAEEDWPKVTDVLDERCTKDGWAAETVACMQAAVRGPDFDACADKLPPEQEASVKAEFEQTIKPLIKEGSMKRKGEEDEMEGGGGATMGSPPPPPDDPCGGDE
jgi:hypothetical protein